MSFMRCNAFKHVLNTTELAIARQMDWPSDPRAVAQHSIDMCWYGYIGYYDRLGTILQGSGSISISLRVC